MATTITINDTLRLDQTAGVQDDDTLIAGDLTGLNSAFRTFLLALAGDLALSADQLAYAASVEAAVSGAGYITVNPDGANITGLFFSDPDGDPFNGDQVIYNGSPLKTVNGDNIYLWSQAGGDIVLATTSSTLGAGDVVAAFYLNDTADNLSAAVEMVTFIALDHPDGTNPDDAVDWTDLLNVSATGSFNFDFDSLRSGSSLWVAVGSEAAGILVSGGSLDVDAAGKKTNASNTIHTSQGGQGATIGVNNQLFDNAGETGVFTLVTGFDNLGGAGGAVGDYVVDPKPNDNKPEGINYDGYLNVSGAGIFLSQSQGNDLKDFDIEVYEAGGGTTPEEGFGYIGTEPSGAFDNDTPIDVKTVTVVDNLGHVVGTWSISPGPGEFASGVTDEGVTVTISGHIIDVNGAKGGYAVSWTVVDGETFNRFQVIAEGGQFDIGGVQIAQGITITEPVGDTLFVDDDGPSVDLVLDGEAELVVDETTLPDSASILAADFLSTNDADFGTDGEGTDASVYALTLSDDNSGLFDTATGDEVLLTINGDGTLITGSVNGGADVVFTIAVDADTGEVTLTQERAMINGDADDPDEADTPLTLPNGLVGLQRTVTDADDDSADDEVDISSIFKFEDDGPSLPPATQDEVELATDDTDIADLASLTTDVLFPGAPDFGNDGPHPTTPIDYSLTLASENANSGLVDTATEKPILFVTEGDDIVGYVDADGDGTIEAGETDEAVRYSLSVVDSDTEQVDFTQSRAVFHDSALPESVLPNLVFVERVAIDGDGDTSEVVNFDLGAITFIEDDEPAIGPIADGLVDFELNDSVNNSLLGDVGNDPNSSPYVLTSFTVNVNAGGVPLQGIAAADNKSVTYWADTSGNGTFGDAGDTAYYTMVLGDQGGPGDYTFTVLVAPGPAFTEFSFDLLPSGANLFGVVESEGSALLVMGKNPVFNADGNYTNASDVIHTSQGGDGATIGVNNQMFDPGDGAYFTFINDPDPNFISGIAGGLTATEADNINNVQYNEDGGDPTLEVGTAFLGISQTQSNKPVSMIIEAFNIDGGPQEEAFAAELGEADNHVDITEVRVYDANGTLLENSDGSVNSASITITIDVDGVATVGGLLRGYTVQWDTATPHDQVLITGDTGKFDIGKFGFLESNEVPDQLLEFTAQVTDGDGDTASDTWRIGIDGTGIHDDDSVSGVVI